MGAVGIGVDIASVDRFGPAAGDVCAPGAPALLLRHCFTDDEWAVATEGKSPARHLALAFAAKEAFLKAVGLGVAAGVPMCDIVLQVKAGHITIEPRGAAAAAMARLGGTAVAAATSSTRGHTLALVVIHGPGPAAAPTGTAP